MSVSPYMYMYIERTYLMRENMRVRELNLDNIIIHVGLKFNVI